MHGLQEQDVNTPRMLHQIEHVLYPAFRKYLTATVSLAVQKRVMLSTTLENLYKVFERC